MEKQNIWFLSLFSMLLILCIYYISIPANVFEEYDTTLGEETQMAMQETDTLISLKIEKEEETLETISTLESKLNDVSLTVEEINEAYEQLKEIHKKSSKEEEIENYLKTTYGYNAFVRIEGKQVSIVIHASTHSKELANEIICAVQSLVEENAYITVKFQ